MNITPKSLLALVACATLALTATVRAFALDSSDRSFLEKAAKAGMKEVAVSQAVLPRLTDSATRDFAQMVVSDHSKANADLKTLAEGKGVKLPADSPKVFEKWSSKTDDVDADYLKEMAKDHKDAVDLFEKAAKSDDPDVAAFAQKTLPTLQHHLEIAKSERKAR